MKVNRVGGKACGSSVPPSFRGLFSYGGASVTVELGGGGEQKLVSAVFLEQPP